MKWMKYFLFSMCAVILFSSLISCSAERDVEERKNLMMPKKSEMIRNSRYKEAGKRKVNKSKHKKSRNKKLF